MTEQLMSLGGNKQNEKKKKNATKKTKILGNFANSEKKDQIADVQISKNG